MASWLLRLRPPLSASSSGPPTLPCMSQDVSGGPPGFYFQATLRMSEKQHGAARETQHAGGALLVSFRAPRFLHIAETQGRTGEDYGRVGARGCRVRCSASPHRAHLPAMAECSACPCFFEVEECQLRSRREKRRVDFSKCQVKGFSRWEEEEKGKMKGEVEEEGRGGTISDLRDSVSFVTSLFFFPSAFTSTWCCAAGDKASGVT